MPQACVIGISSFSYHFKSSLDTGAEPQPKILVLLRPRLVFIFALIIFLIVIYILKKTIFGLQMRAVTQNRKMASAMGINTKKIDMFTFAFGSGVAGVAGVALSQITNVGLNL